MTRRFLWLSQGRHVWLLRPYSFHNGMMLSGDPYSVVKWEVAGLWRRGWKELGLAATQMQLEIIILGEVSQRKMGTIRYRLYVESKIWHKWTSLKNGNRLRDTQDGLVVAKLGGWGAWGGRGFDCKVSAGKGKLLHFEWIDSKTLPWSTVIYSILRDKL